MEWFRSSDHPLPRPWVSRNRLAEDFVINFLSAAKSWHGQKPILLPFEKRTNLHFRLHGSRLRYRIEMNLRGKIEVAVALQGLWRGYPLARIESIGNHKNPGTSPPSDLLAPYIGRQFKHEGHIHVFCEGWELSWAVPYQDTDFLYLDGAHENLYAFLVYTGVVTMPVYQYGLDL